MTESTCLQPVKVIRLDRTLECAVVLSWDELMPDSTSGLIHIEYRTGPDSSLDYLKVWSSTITGHWNLVCEYWIRPLWSHAIGLSFGKGYNSADFAHILELVVRHESAFSKLPDRDGLIQIYSPTSDERMEAERWTRETFNQAGSLPINPLVAA
jgi:hypothetical protein